MYTDIHCDRSATISLCAEEFESLVHTLRACASGESPFPGDYAEVLLQAINGSPRIVFGNRRWNNTQDAEIIRLLEMGLTAAQVSREYVKLHPERTVKAARLRADWLLDKR